jgi:hypothetical protein
MNQREYKIRYRMRHLHGHTPACLRGKAGSRAMHRESRGLYRSYLRVCAKYGADPSGVTIQFPDWVNAAECGKDRPVVGQTLPEQDHV